MRESWAGLVPGWCWVLLVLLPLGRGRSLGSAKASTIHPPGRPSSSATHATLKPCRYASPFLLLLPTTRLQHHHPPLLRPAPTRRASMGTLCAGSCCLWPPNLPRPCQREARGAWQGRVPPTTVISGLGPEGLSRVHSPPAPPLCWGEGPCFVTAGRLAGSGL
jgi:hypothetical protein